MNYHMSPSKCQWLQETKCHTCWNGVWPKWQYAAITWYLGSRSANDNAMTPGRQWNSISKTLVITSTQKYIHIHSNQILRSVWIWLPISFSACRIFGGLFPDQRGNYDAIDERILPNRPVQTRFVFELGLSFRRRTHGQNTRRRRTRTDETGDHKDNMQLD